MTAKAGSDLSGAQERQKEARDLAREAGEERRAGHKEEAQFVLDEAKKLDPGAVEKELHKGGAKPAAKSGKG